jgi:hypothetical protein
MTRTERSADVSEIAGATTLLLGYVALIPGVVPTLALLAVITAVVLAPVLVLALVAGLLALPPLAVWRLATRRRRQRASSQ